MACSKLLVLVVVVLTPGLLVFTLHGHELRLPGRTFKLIAATTPATRARGLGDRASLPANEGMLFVFPHATPQCFWMKAMRFPLDMIWVGTNKRVEYVQPNASPASYPHVFCPNVSARYVIELNAGVARSAGIRVGESLHF